MAQHLRLARLFWLLLAVFTIGRLLMSRVPYDRGHHVFSLVTLTIFSAIYYGAFTPPLARLPRAAGDDAGRAARRCPRRS